MLQTQRSTDIGFHSSVAVAVGVLGFAMFDTGSAPRIDIGRAAREGEGQHGGEGQIDDGFHGS